MSGAALRPAVETLTGERLTAALGDLARLRIAVFRDFPYLYAGSEAYEADYLASYAASPGAVVVAARDAAGAIVGMATATPLGDHPVVFAEPFRALGRSPDRILYLGESVLLPEYRGRGLGHAFFDAREAHGRALGCTDFAFCAVIRPPDHPARPAGYRPLDPFWRRRGYAPVPGLVVEFRWREVGAAAETAHDMQVWMKPG